MIRLSLVGVLVFLVSAVGQTQPKGRAAPPINLEAGKAILRDGEQLILPKGTVILTAHVNGDADLEVGSLRVIPAKKKDWEYEIRPVGRTQLVVRPERNVLNGVEVIFAGKRGQLRDDTTLSGGFLWRDQPYEIRGRDGKVLFQNKGKE